MSLFRINNCFIFGETHLHSVLRVGISPKQSLILLLQTEDLPSHLLDPLWLKTESSSHSEMGFGCLQVMWLKFIHIWLLYWVVKEWERACPAWCTWSVYLDDGQFHDIWEILALVKIANFMFFSPHGDFPENHLALILLFFNLLWVKKRNHTETNANVTYNHAYLIQHFFCCSHFKTTMCYFCLTSFSTGTCLPPGKKSIHTFLKNMDIYSW